jgi:acetyl esterase/lipase
MLRLAPLLLVSTLLAACTQGPPQGSTPYAPSAAMLQVLTERQAMHAKEPADLELSEARDVPSLVDAAHAIPNVVGLPAPTIEVSQFNQPTASGAAGPLSARLYRPALAKNTPAIIFFPGGTWASGSLDTADDTARQLAARTGWVVVTVRTRLAPEATFPAEHDDAMAAYQWARSKLRSWGADPTRVVLGGEGPGANLALSTALLARDSAAAGRPVPLPDYLLLVTPWAGTATGTPSMSENHDFPPLTRTTIRWSQNLYAPDNLRDPRIDLAARQDFAQMPPTLMVLAEIDPLRSSAEGLAARMTAAGVPVETRLYRGATYDFFGLGAKVPEAATAEEDAARAMKAHFVRNEVPVLRGPVRRRR